MNTNDYPSCFLAADSVSNKSQLSYMRLYKFDLLFLIVSAGVAIYNFQLIKSLLFLHVISAITLFFSIILTLILKLRKYDEFWYRGRALAESCKTLTWRFMMCSELFEKNLTFEVAKKNFIKRIEDLLTEFSALNEAMDEELICKPIVTSKMKEVRELSLNKRREYYINERIINQKQWYSEKAKYNARRYNLWFWVILLSQLFAFFSVIFLIVYPLSNWNFVGLFTTLASSAISWLQLKQHQELKQAYTTAALELNIIEELALNINTEEKLSRFVLDSENAISREHTLWLAQRRK